MDGRSHFIQFTLSPSFVAVLTRLAAAEVFFCILIQNMAGKLLPRGSLDTELVVLILGC